jgi:hypothetical protein
MATAPPTPTSLADTDIFLRLWERQKLTPTLARHLLRLGFGPEDKARMHDLAVRNQAGELNNSELQELDAYIRVGALLSILQSRARKLLKQSVRSVNGRG